MVEVWREGGRRKEGRKEGRTAVIKSNNPHLAGDGECFNAMVGITRSKVILEADNYCLWGLPCVNFNFIDQRMSGAASQPLDRASIVVPDCIAEGLLLRGWDLWGYPLCL